ncbi:MAG: hypothetical protein IKW48_01650 [Akkermansia sp.]|nr:hypothetical protein [Akkermansia sp.]
MITYAIEINTAHHLVSDTRYSSPLGDAYFQSIGALISGVIPELLRAHFPEQLRYINKGIKRTHPEQWRRSAGCH